LQLVNQHSVNWRNRAQFYALAARMMRRILINYATARRTEKRGGGAPNLSLDDTIVAVDKFDVDLMALNEALQKLAKLDQRKTDLVEMKFFGGMTTEQIAEVTGKSTSTIEREWTFARSWLYKTLTDQQ
jgi:RNA polymerase sigma factor (TIGR02999 family)